MAPGEGDHSGGLWASEGPVSCFVFEHEASTSQTPVGGNRWKKEGPAEPHCGWPCPSHARHPGGMTLVSGPESLTARGEGRLTQYLWRAKWSPPQWTQRAVEEEQQLTTG